MVSTGTRILPWRRAEQLTHMHLYWMPVRSFPFPAQPRSWIARFILSLEAELAGAIEPEFFLRGFTAHKQLLDTFTANSRKHIPVMGLCRQPGEPIKDAPTLEQLKPVQTGEKPMDLADWISEYSYWMVARRLPEQLNLFFGYGGGMILFRDVDPQMAPPPMPRITAFEETPGMGPDDIQGYMGALYAFRAKFLGLSKEVFGKGLEEHPQYPTLPFIIPAFNSGLYFQTPPDAVAEWFRVFPVQLSESIEDLGLVLASKENLDAALEKLVDAANAAAGPYEG